MNGIVFQKNIFATQGIIENNIIQLAQHINVKYENGEKFGIIHKRLLNNCPKLHTRNDLKELSKLFINDFLKNFGPNELRIWYECTAPLTFSDEMLAMKYNKLLDIHNEWVYKWLKNHNIILNVDALLFGIEIRKEYKKSGVNFNENRKELILQLWGIIKTIHDGHYNKDLINMLENYIKILLQVCEANYYANLDLKNKEVLKNLYNTLCEVNHTSDGFKGHEMFYDYDGYGNTIFKP